jgi:hypothetical protein
VIYVVYDLSPTYVTNNEFCLLVFCVFSDISSWSDSVASNDVTSSE